MRQSIAVLLGIGCLASACSGKLLTIRISEEAETQIEKGTILEDLVGDLGFADFIAMDLTQSTELQNQGVEPGDIVDVRLEAFELEATAPDGADLSFLSSMAVSVEADGLPEETVAEAAAFPEGQPLVVFERPDVDLTDYVTSQAMTLNTEVSGTRPDENTTVVARFTVAVGVTGQGVVSGR